MGGDRSIDPVRQYPMYTVDTVRKHRMRTISPLLSSPKGAGGPPEWRGGELQANDM
jgi:hypothetical protein